MKKLLCMILALTMVFALAACGNDEPQVEPELENEVIEETNDASAPENGEAETEEDENAPAENEPAPNEQKEEEKKPEEKPAQKPAEKPATPPAEKPAAPSAPEQKPAEKPAEPTTPPAEEAPSTGGTVGETLASVWRANSSKGTEEIANAVISHSSIQFMGGVVPVEEGLLSGFDNTEIKGFASAHMFAPGIGTIPFVGYVFELSDGTDADAFVSTLKSSANPRWNICTEAEQTIVEKSGNKVFFLMCPKSFEE